MRYIVALLLCALVACTTTAAEPARRVLLVTHAGGFMHDSILTAEQVLNLMCRQQGYSFTCYRFTADPTTKITVKRKRDGKDVELEMTALEDYSERYQKMMGEPVTLAQCGRINAETLKQFDVVMFFTTSTWSATRGTHPLTESELKDLLAWVEAGGAFVATHCGSDTLHNTRYGDLVGGTFGGHPWLQKVKLHAEDPKHPAARGLTEGSEIMDEIYQFGNIPNHPNAVPLKIQPYSRQKLHIILSVDNSTIDVAKGAREDQDYPVAWCQRFGKGRSFYTSLGHHKEIWLDPRFQEHLMGGIKWALGDAEGDSTPNPKPTTK